MRIDARRPTPLALGIACALILTLAPAALAAQPQHKLPWEGPDVRVKPGSIVVMFASGTSVQERRAIHGHVGGRVDARTPSGIDVVELPAGIDPLTAIRRYQADPRVVSAELDRYATPTQITDDEFFHWQWALHNHHQPHPMTETGDSPQELTHGSSNADVDAPLAWANTTQGDDVIVAVLDTGVDVDHPDLMNSMWVNDAEQTGTEGVDDDGNGYVDDLNGWDFRADDPDPSPGTNLNGSHGTHVAGIVAAQRGNAIGIAGVCGSCRIMALRFDLSLGQEIDAIEYAAANGADVINMSFASPVWSPAERSAIRAAGQDGLLTVAAAGNYSLDNDIATYIDRSFSPAFPASYTLPTILSVAASDHRDRYAIQSECDLSSIPRWRCAFTSWGRNSVDVAAPGVDIISTVAVGGDIAPGYQIWDGTSMAAPLVAGIAGSVLHEHPTYGPLDLKNAVMNGTDDPSELELLTSWADLTGVSKQPIEGDFTRTQGRVDAEQRIVRLHHERHAAHRRQHRRRQDIRSQRAGPGQVARRRERRLPEEARRGEPVPDLAQWAGRQGLRPLGLEPGRGRDPPVHDRMLPPERSVPGAQGRLRKHRRRRTGDVPGPDDRRLLHPGAGLVLGRPLHPLRPSRLTRAADGLASPEPDDDA